MVRRSLVRKEFAFLIVVFFIATSLSSPITGFNLKPLFDNVKGTKTDAEIKTSPSNGTVPEFQDLQWDSYRWENSGMYLNRYREQLQTTQQENDHALLVSYENTWMHALHDGNYTPHQPISIYGNAEFTSTNGVVGGNGTLENPYIIEGWSINDTATIGIWIQFTTSHFIVRDCLIPTSGGVYLTNATNGTVADVIFHDAFEPVMISECSNICIRDSALEGFDIAFIGHSSHVTVENCSVFSLNHFAFGVRLVSSPHCVLANLTVSSIQEGINIRDSRDTLIRGCDVTSNILGISISSSPHQILRDNHFYNNTYNLGSLQGSSIECYDHDIDTSNTINGKPIYYLHNKSDLTFNDTDAIGFLGLINCRHILLDHIIPENNSIGLLLVGTTSSSITSSVFSNPSGVILFLSPNNSISNCSFPGSGIDIAYSPHTMVRNLAITAGYIIVDGETLQDYYQDIDRSNTVDGKPITYLIEKNNLVFKDSEVGFLAFVNCKNVMVTGLRVENLNGLLLANTTGSVKNSEIMDSFIGVTVFGSSRLTIKNCWIHDVNCGVALLRASNVTIRDCLISGFLAGIDLLGSSRNDLSHCVITNIGFNAIQLVDSCNNTLCCSCIYSCGKGVEIDGSSNGNELFYNTISDGYFGIILGSNGTQWPRNTIIHHTVIERIRDDAIDLGSSNGTRVDHNTIDSSGMAIDMRSGLGCAITWNNICSDPGLRVESTIPGVNATNNWWGSKDGPGGIGPGNGTSIKGPGALAVRYFPWVDHRIPGIQLTNALITILLFGRLCILLGLRFPHVHSDFAFMT